MFYKINKFSAYERAKNFVLWYWGNIEKLELVDVYYCRNILYIEHICTFEHKFKNNGVFFQLCLNFVRKYQYVEEYCCTDSRLYTSVFEEKCMYLPDSFRKLVCLYLRHAIRNYVAIDRGLCSISINLR